MNPNAMQALRTFALRLPETEEGVACEGTAIESRTLRRNGKAYLFLRSTEARLKLGPSVAEASARAAKEPKRYSVGAHGWTLVKLDGGALPLEVLRRWVAESHALFGREAATKPKATKKRAAKRG